MEVSIIAAIAENRAIGKDNDLIWTLPKDMAFFRNTTMGHPVIMGRKNFESIPHKWRPLEGRENIVVTRNKGYHAPGTTVVQSLETAIEYAQQIDPVEIFIIGGGQIYDLAIQYDLVTKMYLTKVHESFEADVFFPEYDKDNWVKVKETQYPVDEKHPHAFTIFEYLKRVK